MDRIESENGFDVDQVGLYDDSIIFISYISFLSLLKSVRFRGHKSNRREVLAIVAG